MIRVIFFSSSFPLGYNEEYKLQYILYTVHRICSSCFIHKMSFSFFFLNFFPHTNQSYDGVCSIRYYCMYDSNWHFKNGFHMKLTFWSFETLVSVCPRPSKYIHTYQTIWLRPSLWADRFIFIGAFTTYLGSTYLNFSCWVPYTKPHMDIWLI